MLETPFTFPDGDHYPIYVSTDSGGNIVLSDRGHTLMHMSYEHDVDPMFDGKRAALREQIVRELDIQEANGAFSVRTTPAGTAEAVFRLGVCAEGNPRIGADSASGLSVTRGEW